MALDNYDASMVEIRHALYTCGTDVIISNVTILSDSVANENLISGAGNDWSASGVSLTVPTAVKTLLE